jgi:hypothetical protein
MKTIFKSGINIVGVFLGGFGISTAFVLVSNDIFYKYFLRRIFLDSNSKADELWNEIKPRELFGQGAKNTFVKNQINEERDDEAKRYHDEIDRRRSSEGIVDYKDEFTKNIYARNKSRNL